MEMTFVWFDTPGRVLVFRDGVFVTYFSYYDCSEFPRYPMELLYPGAKFVRITSELYDAWEDETENWGHWYDDIEADVLLKLALERGEEV